MAISGTKGTRAVLTRYPITSGLTAETTRTYDRQINLVPTKGSLVARRKKVGL
jgi:hypothetical protein|tara:strand:- start:1231 stop:1389 length:159 start_codon:yes stop_codon:yes gene_type:complete